MSCSAFTALLWPSFPLTTCRCAHTHPAPPPLSHTCTPRSANLMTAAVYGRQSLDELQKLVVDAFSPVVNKQLPVPTFSPDVVCDEVCSVCVRVCVHVC